MTRGQKILAAITAFVLALAGYGITVELVDDDRPDQPRKRSVTVRVDGPDQDVKRDDKVVLTPPAQGVAEAYEDRPRDLDDDKPGAAPLAGEGEQVAVGKIPAPLGADEIDGCRTRFLPTNFSQRSYGQDAVIWFGFHFTGGRDIPNSRADVDGLTAYGSRSTSRVSWHFNLDKDGNCDYNVPLRLKAWTLGNANSRSINVEVHGSGEPPYLRPAGYRKMALILRQVRKSYPRIRLRLGSLSNCGPGTPGLVTHWMGGACSGGHTDIRPHAIAEVVGKLRSLSAGPTAAPVLRRWCRHVERHRRIERAGSTTPAQRAHQRIHLADVKRRGYRCEGLRPVKA